VRFDKHVFFSALTVVFLAVLVCFRFFGEVILHPDEFLFGDSGDGLKNYFAVAYQVIHGEGTWFSGMLYPYGDHLIFADGQPLLSKVLSLFIEPDVNNGTQIIAIMNLLMLGSLLLTAWCVHRLLVWNYVNPWFAVPFSLTIAFLSPQLARFIGHYALAYTFFVPMSWLLIAGFSRTKWPWVLSVFTSIIILLFGFLHPYYLFIFVIFLGAIIGWELIIERFRLNKVEHVWARVFALIVPLILFMIYQSGADPYVDRPTAPSGIFSYMTTFQSVFIPVNDPFRSLFNSYFFRIFIPGNWEGHAYIGLVASFTAFVSVVALANRLLKRRWKTLTHPVLPTALKTAFVPGILTLLFALGAFHHLGLYWLSDFISPLKQFRSLGRIAWIFYYVFSIWTVYHLYVLFRHFKSASNGRYGYHIGVIVGLCAFVWMLDAIVNIKFNKAHMMNREAKEAFSDQYVSQWKAAGVKVEDHQAIVPLPFMLVGSEKIGLENGPKSLMHAMKGSFSSGLPMVGGTMSRTSLEVTEKSAQLVSNPLIERKILKDLNPDKKLLFLRLKESLSGNEQWLINEAELVYESEDYRLFSASVSSLRDKSDSYRNIPDSLQPGNVSANLRPINAELNNGNLWGAETYSVKASDILFDSIFTASETLLISYWVKVDPAEELLPNWRYSIDNEKVDGGGIGKSPDLLDGWLLVEQTIQTEAGKKHVYQFTSRGGVIGRVQLREPNEQIVWHEGDLVFVNNIPLR
jgi:hypothetical protein